MSGRTGRAFEREIRRHQQMNRRLIMTAVALVGVSVGIALLLWLGPF